MWRSFFLALGAFAVIFGAECLAIDRAVLSLRHEPVAGFMQDAGRHREFVPPDWAPWSLMSFGAVTMLYSFTIPKKISS
jgi:hypothetical protein